MALGFHVGKMAGKGIHEGLAWSLKNTRDEHEMDMRSAQIFVLNPRNGKDLLTDEDAVEVKKLVDATKLRLIVHGCYIAHPFGEKAAQALHLIKKELAWCNSIGAEGFVIHLPRRDADQIASLYPHLLAHRGATKIFLEIESMKATDHTYETPEKLRNLYAKLLPIDPDVGLCVDTAHMWSSGVDDREYAPVKSWIDAVEAIGIRHIMFHLNDSNRQRGSGQDNHHRLTHGFIWREFNMDTGTRDIRESGLAAFLEWIVRRDMVVILERDEAGIDLDFNVLRRMGYFQLEKKP